MVQTVAAPAGATFEGSILGTVGYMSPEQASGRPVDFRSDQFALGLLVYEMLAGRRAFERPSAVETLSAIIREDPVPIASVRRDISEAFQRVIARCLAKLPKDRFDSTRDLAAALATLEHDSATITGSPVVVHIPSQADALATPETRPRLWRRSALVGVTLLMVAAAAATWSRFGTTARPSIDSLAVLPFENASDDKDAEYLGDGLTDTLIDRMSRVQSLAVKARGAVFRFKGTRDPQAAGQQLGVGAVLTGRVTRRGDRLTISAELIEIATGLRLWGETYDGAFADVLQMQDSIASSISEGLRLRLSSEQKRTLARHGTDNVAAYELYLRARSLMTHDTEEDDGQRRISLNRPRSLIPDSSMRVSELPRSSSEAPAISTRHPPQRGPVPAKSSRRFWRWTLTTSMLGSVSPPAAISSTGIGQLRSASSKRSSAILACWSVPPPTTLSCFTPASAAGPTTPSR